MKYIRKVFLLKCCYVYMYHAAVFRSGVRLWRLVWTASSAKLQRFSTLRSELLYRLKEKCYSTRHTLTTRATVNSFTEAHYFNEEYFSSNCHLFHQLHTAIPSLWTTSPPVSTRWRMPPCTALRQAACLRLNMTRSNLSWIVLLRQSGF